MFTALLAATLVAPAPVPAPITPLVPALVQDADVDAKIKEAGDDVDKLLALADEYKKASDRASSKKVLQRVIEIDVDNAVARKGLRHQRYDGKWFTSYVELSKYKRGEAARMKEKGLAKWRDQWVPADDIPFLNMGWTKSDDGKWSNPIDAARQKQIEEWMAAGFQFRADDNSWVAPDDFDKWGAVQFKCGDEWLDLAGADAYHSKVETAWELAGEHFEVMTTCSWNTGNAARWHADRTHEHLVRLFGTAPTKRMRVALLKSLAEYNDLAANTPVFAESEGFSSLHGAYFADMTFDPRTDPPQYSGCGVSYWDVNDEKVSAWGPFWLRWAAAQSFVEGIDPSWNAIGAQMAAGAGGGGGEGFPQAFWGEKMVPRWLRYGAAAYAERFLPDPMAQEGADPWALRTFAFGELKKAGGLRPLEELFAFGLSLEDIESSSRMYNEAGLVVSYLLDGASGDAKIEAAHAEFKAAMAVRDGDRVRAAAKVLQDELGKREKEIRKYAGL